MRLRRAAVLFCVVVVAACTPKPPEPVTLPTQVQGAPTVTAVPTPTPDETVRLQAEAKQAYLTAMEEWDRIRLRNESEMGPRMEEVATGAFLGEMESLLAKYHAEGAKVSGTITHRAVNQPGQTKSGSDPLLTLRACDDGRNATYVKGDMTRPGQLAEQIVYVKVIDGRAKVVEVDGETVEQCSF